MITRKLRKYKNLSQPMTDSMSATSQNLYRTLLMEILPIGLGCKNL